MLVACGLLVNVATKQHAALPQTQNEGIFEASFGAGMIAYNQMDSEIPSTATLINAASLQVRVLLKDGEFKGFSSHASRCLLYTGGELQNLGCHQHCSRYLSSHLHAYLVIMPCLRALCS